MSKKITGICLLCALLGVFGGLTRIEAAPIIYISSVPQGFDFQQNGQDVVGFINELQISDVTLSADFSVTNPEDYTLQQKVVGVLSGISWSGEYADPILFSCQVSAANKNALSTMMHKSLANTEVAFLTTVYDYDPKAQGYYRTFYSDDQLRGSIVKNGGMLALNIELDPSYEVLSPENFRFTLGVMPQSIRQELHVAVSQNDEFVKPWGLEGPTPVVPEPATILLIGSGLIGLAGIRRMVEK
jgi:hypothetical protein